MKNLIFIICTFYSVTIFSQQYELLPSSIITVDGTSTLLDWTVNAEEFSGSLTVEAKKKSNKAIIKGVISGIHLLIPVNRMRSEKGETMDNKMHRALKMEEFSSISYSLINSVEFESIDEKNKILTITGILNIAGVEKTIQSDVRVTYINQVLFLSGKIPFKFNDFNIDPPSAMFGQIETGEDIEVNFTLEYKN